MRKLASIAIGVMIGFSANAQEEPKYDCSALETKQYIEQVTHNVFAPSPIATPDEFHKAYTEEAAAKAEMGDEDASTCVTIFTDGELKDDWKALVDTVRNMDIDINFSGFDAAMLQQLLKKAKERVTAEVTGALEKLGEDVCALMSTDSIKGMLLDSVNEKYGWNARNLRMRDFATEVTQDYMRTADDDILMLLSEDEMLEEVQAQSRQEMRKIRKDIWKNF